MNPMLIFFNTLLHFVFFLLLSLSFCLTTVSSVETDTITTTTTKQNPLEPSTTITKTTTKQNPIVAKASTGTKKTTTKQNPSTSSTKFTAKQNPFTTKTSTSAKQNPFTASTTATTSTTTKQNPLTDKASTKPTKQNPLTDKASTKPTKFTAKQNPFTAKASLIRYWNNQISNKLPKPAFLLSKASPLSAIDSAFFAKLANQKSLSSHLTTFCSAANLFCYFDSTATSPPSADDSDFTLYSNKKFSNYGSDHLTGADSFKNYSLGINFAAGSFTKYSRGSTGHVESFTTYAKDANVASSNFTSYAADATGGSGEFKTYHPLVNVPDLKFASYDSGANNHKLTFSSYAGETNAGDEGFASYSKNGNNAGVDFTGYGVDSNIIGSGFNGYGELGNAANDSFKAYSSNSNNPKNNFKNYGAGGNAAIDTFSSYRDSANTGTDSFQSYGKNSNSEKTNFINYGKSFNQGTDTFSEYSKNAIHHSAGFKIYGSNNTFKGYAHKESVTFAGYAKQSSSQNGNSVNKWVEEGKFFREYMLKEGTVMKMPDIRDKMPQRSFLPRVILSNIPFSNQNLSDIKAIFHARENSSLEKLVVNALAECERSPSRGETKQCVGSIEDMIDFAVSVLGHNVVARSTENVNGSGKNVMIGKVMGINGGDVTKSVSCHQSLYPYLLYYCHSVPKVRVYVAEILDVESKVKINDGVAICHIDTSAWSPGHGAFVALGSTPGIIEVCHWIFENDLTWARGD